MNKEERIEDLKELIIKASELTKHPLVFGEDFYIEYQGKGQHGKALPNNASAVYTFFYNDRVLKVGQTYYKGRYQYSHYKTFRNTKNGISSLARSLLDDVNMETYNKSDEEIKNWIINNTERFDIILLGERDAIKLNFVEGLLQQYLQPRYEKNKKETKEE